VRRLLLFLLALPLLALTVELQWVEVHLSLTREGKADIVYITRWRVKEGVMHGFYLEGIGKEPHFNLERCFIQDDSGKKLPLRVNRISRYRYDVYNSTGVPPEEYFFVVNFAEDFVREGYLAYTTSKEL